MAGAGAGVTGGAATTGWRGGRNGFVVDGSGRGATAGALVGVGLETGAAELTGGIGVIWMGSARRWMGESMWRSKSARLSKRRWQLRQ